MKIYFMTNVLMISAILLVIAELSRPSQVLTESSIYAAFKKKEISDENNCDISQQRLKNSCLKYHNNLRRETFKPQRDFLAQYKLNEKNFGSERHASKHYVRQLILEDLRLYYLSRACEGLEDKYLDCQKLQEMRFSCNDNQDYECNDLERIVANVYRGTIRGEPNSQDIPEPLIFPEILAEIHKLNYPKLLLDGRSFQYPLLFILRAPQISPLSLLDKGRYLLALALTSTLFLIVLRNK